MATIHVSAQYSEQDLMEEANALFEKGAFADAMPLYSQLLSLNPTNPVFNYKYGATALYGDAEKKEEAVKYLKFSVGKPNVDDQSWYYLGRAYHLNYLFQDAITAYEKYKTLASNSDLEEKEVNLKISMARSGQNLLSQIKEIKVLDKKQTEQESFFRIYDLSDIGGKILVTPEELLSSEDKKRNHKSLIHFRGSGTTIYFSSYGKSGKTGLDIYHADVLPDGTYTDPVPIQGAINTPFDEDFPYLHPDDQTFYFSSKGHGSMGGYDVFKSGFNKSTGVFSKPVNLDFAVNTPDDDLFYLADSLNEMAYFASARSSKQGQLDVYKVLVKSAPLDITLIKGTFINRIDPNKKLAKITTIDATTNEEVDVQYTDPATGEYVLSFPKGGKYKFLVEEKTSDKIHAGIVNVPTSAGVMAYLQEMELISSVGVEKLLINNLFDQTYQGDVMALAQKMLRQRAALDVNFDPETTPEEEIATNVQKNPSLAYTDAGFGAGMSNEKVLEEAEARVEELKDRQILAAQYAAGAATISEEYFKSAQEKKSSAEGNVTESTSLQEDTRNEKMYQAGLARMQSINALRKASNAKSLKEELFERSIEAEAKYQEEKARVDSLRKAIDSNEYDAIYASLLLEKEAQESVDKVEDRFEPVQDIRRTGLKAEQEAKKLLDKAQYLRDQQEKMSASLTTKRTQREKMKGKALKEIEEEIAVLESDIESTKRKTERAFKMAEDAQLLANDKTQEYEILTEIAESNDPTATPTLEAPTIAWSDSDQKLLAENLSELEIDNDAVAAYTREHPEVFDEMGSEALAMSFRQTYQGSASPTELADGTPLGVDQEQTAEQISGSVDTKPETEAAELGDVEGVGQVSAITQEDLAYSERDGKGIEAPMPLKETAVAETSSEKQSTEQGMVSSANEDTGNLDNDEGASTPFKTDYDETLPVEKRIEAEQIKIEAAEDWVAIIDESIEQLESGAGGEEGAEEQLADYQKLKEQKLNEIEQRQELINDWSEEVADRSDQEALARAAADVDSLDIALITRLESKIVDYSTELATIKTVSQIDRDYLPTLTEIEISGLSAPELAEQRIKLNEGLIADIDQIMTEGISSEVSEEDLIEMRRVKLLELRQDREVLEGKVEFVPRSSEAQQYAELINEDTEPQVATPGEQGDNFTEISPEMAESLQKEFTTESIFPEYSSLLKGAERTTNPSVAAVQRLEIKEELLKKFSSEIALYKAAVEVAENPDPQLIDRYSILLSERSKLIDSINDDKEFLENVEEVAETKSNAISADSLITALRAKVLDPAEGDISEFPSVAEVQEINQIISSQIDEYISVIDDPKSGVNRDLVQVEIQKLEEFQNELSELNDDELMDPGDPSPAAESQSQSASIESEELERTDSTESINENATNESEGAKVLADENEEFAEVVSDNDRPESDDISELSSEETPPTDLEEILSISEKIASDYEKEALLLSKQIGEEDQELEKLSELNAAVVESIEIAIDSLNSIKLSRDTAVRNVIDNEIMELEAISADKQQESDRLLAEAELSELAQAAKEETETVKPESISVANEGSLTSMDDLESIQYKSLNASMIKNGLKSKIDSLGELRVSLKKLPQEDSNERAVLLERMEQIQLEVDEGIQQSNVAEIKYYQSENQRILSQLDANISVNREKILKLQSETSRLRGVIADLEQNRDREEQLDLITELSAINASLVSLEELNPDSDRSAVLEVNSSALLEPESHEKTTNKAYLTVMQASVAQALTEERREELKAQNPNLNLDLRFAFEKSLDNKKSLIENSTKVDPIGLDLLAETPAQLDYLVAMIKADSLKSLEQKSASNAAQLQAQAIERISEADRLLKMIPNQETDLDREAVRERAKKLEVEAQVIFEKSALSAEQAEAIRSKRSQNDQELIALSTELSFRQRRALDDLLLKPGYRIIPSEEDVAENRSEPVEPTPEKVTKNTETSASLHSGNPPTDAESKKLNSSENEGIGAIKGNWLGMVEIIAEKDDFSDVTNSMFVEAEASVYSVDKPIPVDPVMPNGLIFQVQVGAYRNPIPQDLFGAYAPIMGQKLDNGITRYRAGLFKKYQEAIQARNEIRVKGYSDAFVVVYVDGEKLTGDQARDILAQAKAEESISLELISGVPSTESNESIAANTEDDQAGKVEYYNDPEAAEAEQVEVISGLFYTVQVGVYSKPVKLDQLFNLTELNSELTQSGVIRYTTGRFGNLKEASKRKEIAKSKGVNDAFVTAYYNGKRISLPEAEKKLAENGMGILAKQVSADSEDKTLEKNSAGEDNTYVVIMGAFKDDVPRDLADLFLENKSWGIRKIQGPGSTAIYMSEDINSLEEARQLLEKCKKLNIKSAYIGTIKDGQITSVQND